MGAQFPNSSQKYLYLPAGLVYCQPDMYSENKQDLISMFKPNTFNHSIQLTLMLAAFLMLPAFAQATNVIITTPLGEIELEMLEDDAPNTVANFLQYVNEGNYVNSFMHRLEPGFIMQGGGYVFEDGAKEVKINASIDNEFKVSNTRGTVAMAKFPNNPNSASSQWFINLADNSANLDNQNGGYTVFAIVVNGMDVVDAINELEVLNSSNTFQTLPVINYSAGTTITEANLVMTSFVEVAGPELEFEMNAGLNDAWYNPATAGQGFFVTVFPTIGKVLVSWFTYDTELPAADAPGNLEWAGHRWMNGFGDIAGNSAVMEIDIPSGGLFDTPTTVEHTPSGTMTITFENCNAAVIEYDITTINRQGTIPIQRIAGDNIELCQTLAGIEPATP